MNQPKEKYVWGLLRLAIGWLFLWAFVDKLFGLGFATAANKSWLAGASPTAGFLKSAAGPFAPLYQSIAGNPVVDWLFMLGLLLMGLALILGIGIKVACYSGSLLMFMMWTSHLPPSNNPFLDDHLIYILVLVGITLAHAGQYLGLGKWWSSTSLVKKFPFLE